MTVSIEGRVWTALADLVAVVDGEGFRAKVLETLAPLARVSDFTVFTLPDSPDATPGFSFGAGALGDHQIQRNFDDLQRSESYFAYLKSLVENARLSDTKLYRDSPDKDSDPVRWGIFERSRIIEKLYTVRFDGDVAYLISYFRNQSDGIFSDQEIDRLSQVIPVIDGLIILRHKVVRGGERRVLQRDGLVAGLRSKQVAAFAKLSAREVEVCDCIVRGLTTEGTALDLSISVSSIKTLRERAYTKLGISSRSELFAMLLNAHG